MFQQPRIAVLSLPTIALTLVLEYAMPKGVFISAGYIIAVIITIYSPTKLNAVISSAGACLAILFAVFFLHPSEDFTIVAINHAFSLAGVVAAMFFVMYVKNLQRDAEKGSKQVGSLFFHATEGIILTNRKGEIELINPCAERMFGYEKDELVGKRIEILIPSDKREKHTGLREHFHKDPSPRTMGEGRDLYAIKKDGHVFPVEISLSHYKIGSESYATAFIIDITVRKRNYEQLQSANAEIGKLNVALEQKVKDRTTALHETLSQLEKSRDELSKALDKEKEVSDLKSRFVSTVSHEFRTPLSTILSSASLIRSYENAEEKDKRERHINRIEESVSHMNAMLEDLLSLGKLEEGLIEAKADTFDIKKFVDDFIAEMSESNKKGHFINYKHAGKEIVETDKRLLKNILINLVSNAIKFSPAYGLIEIFSTAENGRLNISVKDSGIGISEEDQKHLFERFFRGNNVANVKGTGLGLHIVTKYLDLLGGTIGVKSKLNEGTTFSISIIKTNKHEEDTGNRG